MAQTDSGIAAYGRLSREDERDKTTAIEQKVELRKAILVTLARHHDIALTNEQITFELKSGGSLQDRPGILAILERCRRREIHTLIIFDIDRLCRDVGDWKLLETAFFRTQVRLITGAGTYHFTRDFDPTLLQIKAILGESERRKFGFRRKAANEQRARSGQLSQGYAPYGYAWSVADRAFRVKPDEYAILEEIFRRIRSEGAGSIAADLTARGVPTAGSGKRENPSRIWLRGTVHNIVRNPFYAGRLVKRRESDREGLSQWMPRSAWIISESDLEIQHPVSWDDWEEIQEIVRSRSKGAASRALLTGLLRCSQGQKMHKTYRIYVCGCQSRLQPHKGRTMRATVIERIVLDAAIREINALPVSALRPSKRKAAATNTAAHLAAARRELREKEATIQDLTRRASWYQSLPSFGAEGHARTLEAVCAEADALRKRVRHMEEAQTGVDPVHAIPVLRRIREIGGASVFFERASVSQAREVLTILLHRVQLEPVPEGRGFNEAVALEWRAPFGTGGIETVAIPHWRTGQTGRNRRHPEEQAD